MFTFDYFTQESFVIKPFRFRIDSEAKRLRVSQGKMNPHEKINLEYSKNV